MMRLFRESVVIMLSSHFWKKIALSEQENLSLSQNNISILFATDTNELTIGEDLIMIIMILKTLKKLTMFYLVME